MAVSRRTTDASASRLSDSEVHIDYRAAIDIGLPELWTQSYKEKFVREFLTAACEQAETTASPAALALAAEP